MLLKSVSVKNILYAIIGFLIINYVCSSCHDLKILCLNISDIAIATIKGVDYRCIMHDISKSEAIRLLENSVFDDHKYKKF